MNTVNGDTPNYWNSMKQVDENGPGIKKLMRRNVNGEERLVMKTNDKNYYVATDKGWERIDIAKDGLFRKKSFTYQPQEIFQKSSDDTAVVNKETYVAASSPAQVREEALNGLKTNFDKAVNEYTQKNNGENSEPLWLNNLSTDDIKNLENGTPVYVTKPDGKGGNLARTGVIYNGMLIQDKEVASSLGSENNYRSLYAIDPNAYRKGDENYRIGAVQMFNDGDSAVALEASPKPSYSAPSVEMPALAQTVPEQAPAAAQTPTQSAPANAENTAETLQFETQVLAENDSPKTEVLQSSVTAQNPQALSAGQNSIVDGLNSFDSQQQINAVKLLMAGFEQLETDNPKPESFTADDIVNGKDLAAISDGTYALVRTPNGKNRGGRIIGGEYIVSKTTSGGQVPGNNYFIHKISDLIEGNITPLATYFTYEDGSRPQIRLQSDPSNFIEV